MLGCFFLFLPLDIACKHRTQYSTYFWSYQWMALIPNTLPTNTATASRCHCLALRPFGFNLLHILSFLFIDLLSDHHSTSCSALFLLASDPQVIIRAISEYRSCSTVVQQITARQVLRSRHKTLHRKSDCRILCICRRPFSPISHRLFACLFLKRLAESQASAPKSTCFITTLPAFLLICLLLPVVTSK